MAQVMAYTAYTDRNGLFNRMWVDISQVRYTVSSAHDFSTVGCNICSPTQLREINGKVEVAHWISTSPLGWHLEWVGDYLPPNEVQGITQGMVITGITATPSNNSNFPASSGWIYIQVSATGSGSFNVTIDGATVATQTGNAGTGASWGYYKQVSPGTHNICAAVV